MSKVALKKYASEQLNFDLENYLNNITHEFAVNWLDKTKITSDAKAKQLLTVKKDYILLKAKTIINVLGVSATKDFKERILKNLPSYERKEPLIMELAYVISEEFKKIELKNNEGLSSLNVSTSNPINLKNFEKLYGVNPPYELGLKVRMNLIIAREITRYSTFNFRYILKMCELFTVGEVADVVNDKENKIIKIMLKDNVNNIPTIDIFRNHMLEFAPAFYAVLISN